MHKILFKERSHKPAEELLGRCFFRLFCSGLIWLSAVFFTACEKSEGQDASIGAGSLGEMQETLSAAEMGGKADEPTAAGGISEASGTENAENPVSAEAETAPLPLTAVPVEEAERVRTWDIHLGFAGDINFADDYIPVQYLASLGSEDISDGIDQRFIDLMRGMDLMWINNEFAYSTRGEPLYGKAFTFRSDPAHVSWMQDLGIDIVGLANNHVFDYGEEAFQDTLKTLEDAGIPYVGAGRNLEEAMRPVYLKADGFTIAYVAASCAEYTVYTQEATETQPGILACYDNTQFLEAIREAAAHADYVIALPHWGAEHSTWLVDQQVNGAQAYLEAGADAVIGAHTHILQGLQFTEGKPVLYSLGNFWFDNFDIDTMVAELHFTGTCKSGETPSLRNGTVEVILHPGTQSGVFTAWADTPEWRRAIFDLLESISLDVTIDDDGKAHALTFE